MTKPPELEAVSDLRAALLPDLQLELVPLSSLRRFERRIRIHPQEQLDGIRHLIETLGFCIPVVIDRENNLVDGEGRAIVLADLGLDVVPAVRAEHLTPEQARALRVADKRMAELSTWDVDGLAAELEDLVDNFDLELPDLGLNPEAVAELLGDVDLAAEANGDRPPAGGGSAHAQRRPPVSREGDVWALGAHLLEVGAGDATDADELVRGWQRRNGRDAVLQASGDLFASVAVQREA